MAFEDLPEPLLAWRGFAIRKQGERLDFYIYLDTETRSRSLIDLIKESFRLYDVPDFDWMLVNVGDRDDDEWLAKARLSPHHVLCRENRICKYLTTNYSGLNRSNVIPDFFYDKWPQTGLDDFAEESLYFQTYREKPASNKLGWRGANTHRSRERLIALNTNRHFDFKLIEWNRENPDKLSSIDFVSMRDQLKLWRYLIDTEGAGYSARLKLLLHAPRVVFIQERRYKEDFFNLIEPWIHFVPVASDLSDLEKNFLYIRTNLGLERSIINSANEFAINHLTRKAALRRMAEKFRYISRVSDLKK